MVLPQQLGAQASEEFAMQFKTPSHSTLTAAQYIASVAVDVLGTVEPPFSPIWSKVKNIFGFLIFIIDIAILVVCPYGIWLIEDINDTDGGIGLFSAAMPFTFLSAAWVAADLGTQMRRGVNKPIAPSVHIAYHFISWLSMSIIASLWAAYSVSWEDLRIEDELSMYESLGMYLGDPDYVLFLKSEIVVHKLGITGLSLLYIAAMLHFVLFIRACIDTNQERNYKKAVKFAEMVRVNHFKMGHAPAAAPSLHPSQPVRPKSIHEMHQVPMEAVELEAESAR